MEPLWNVLDPSYPASYVTENMVAVASINSLDRLSSFSNYGVKSVHVAGPGGVISIRLIIVAATPRSRVPPWLHRMLPTLRTKVVTGVARFMAD